jgi:hypothetical protein
MSFFHNLNKTLDGIAARPEAAQLNERDEGKPGKNFEKIAKGAAERYGSKEAGERVAGAVRAKLAKAGKLEEQDMDEGLVDVVKKVGGMAKKAGSAVLNKVGHGDDVDMIRDLQRKMGMPPTGEKPKQVKEKTDPEAFAALAPPKDKITFADKIAGAKKEVDEMLGDVAAEAMRNALGGRQQVADEGNAFTGKLKATAKGGKFKMGNKEYTDTSGIDEEEDLNPFTNYKKPRAATPRTGEVTHGAKHDIKHTATGRVVTRRVDPQGMSVGSETDAEGNTIEKRGRGRPKGPEKGPERTTAKAYKHKGGRKMSEEEINEAIAALEQCGYSVTALEEESTDKKDNRAERAGKKVAKDIEYDEKKKDGIHGKKRGAEDDRAEKAGKKVAKDIEHDEKEDADKEDKPKKSNSKFKFGGSVYEALDAQLETLITEGMSVTVNMSQDDEHGEGRKNITVNADGEDADRLAELLQMAGVSQHEEACSSCGSSPCGCDVIDENNPNWPSNTETSDNALQYSGGLNGPKSTGQSTVPVLASQLRRQVSMEESARVEQNLMNLYRTFGK